MSREYHTTCTSSNEYYTACRNIILSCKYCHNAFIDGELTSENDLSYCSVGDSDKNYNIMFRTGDGRKTGIVFSKYSERYKRNLDVGYYYPKYCPECGRQLIENEKKEFIEPINQTIISITPPDKSTMELIEKLSNGLSWKSYNKESELKEHTLYLVAGEAIIGKGNYYYKLCRYANKLCDVDSSDFPEHKYNYSSFYFYDNECGYVNLDNVKFYMEVPEVPKSKGN